MAGLLSGIDSAMVESDGPALPGRDGAGAAGAEAEAVAATGTALPVGFPERTKRGTVVSTNKCLAKSNKSRTGKKC